MVHGWGAEVVGADGEVGGDDAGEDAGDDSRGEVGGEDDRSIVNRPKKRMKQNKQIKQQIKIAGVVYEPLIDEWSLLYRVVCVQGKLDVCLFISTHQSPLPSGSCPVQSYSASTATP